MIRALRWDGDRDGYPVLVEQTLLPDRFEEVDIKTPQEMVAAIQRLAVRGAPAIGIAAAYGICVATRGLEDADAIDAALDHALPLIRESRPTAINLHHMVDRMRGVIDAHTDLRGVALRERLLEEARAIHREDEELCDAMGRAGAPLIRDGMSVLTHCNAGALATGGSGTALAVMYAAAAKGVQFQVYADETRPLLQGARLTAWELQQEGIPVTILGDNAAATMFAHGEIDLVITGSDRVAANGDAANKIGTYGVAVLAQHHDVPFYIAAPSTTFDFSTPTGQEIPIEERAAEEVWGVSWKSAPPAGISVRNPAFDVTPKELIHGWITENGIVQPPFDELR
ncbi:MAG: S-methyl-5-thioribose-1-phosphate isomerase [Planctomycetota bacterium]